VTVVASLGSCTRRSPAKTRQGRGIVEIVDPRPSCRLTRHDPQLRAKTGRLVIARSGATAGFAEVAAVVTGGRPNSCDLKAPVKRVCALAVRYLQPVLENHVFPDRNGSSPDP